MAEEARKASPKPDERRVLERRVSERRSSGTETRTILPKHHVFREGELGDLAFIVKTGEIEIYKTVGDKKVVLGVLGPGGMFGEMALIDDSPRMASAHTINDGAVVMVISRQVFARKMAKMDPFARGLIKILSNYVRSKSHVEETVEVPQLEPIEETALI